MARTSKKETVLTAEEKLAHAVMPEAEQPYQVPQNWCWVTIGSVLTLQAGKNISSSLIADVKDIDHPYLCFGGNGIRGYVPTFNRDGQFPIIGRQGALCGNLNWADGQFYATEHAVVVECPEFVDKKWAYYILDYMNLNQYSTATAQPGLAVGNILKLPLSLPPIAEQQRIVDRIESLFAKLDEAKEKAQEVVDGYDARRAAILHKAFTGELTAEWRKSKNTSLESWLTQTLKDSCSIGSGGTPSRKKPEYFDGLIPWIKTGEIDWNEIYDSEEHISQSAIDNSSAKLYPIGAVLVAMYGMGATRGRAAILNVDATTNQAVCVLQPKDYLVNRFLFYYFMCNYWDVREKAVGGNQLNLSATIIAKFVIRIPTIDEQKEIIRILDSLLLKEQQAKETAEQVIDQIDTMKKSILARAFRGELGTNDPADENAEELLKRIL